MEYSSETRIHLEVREGHNTKATAKGEIQIVLEKYTDSNQNQIQLYELILFETDSNLYSQWSATDPKLLQEYLILKLQEFINSNFNPNKHSLEVVEDSSGIFERRSGYCQHCKKKILEYFGICNGVIKKCRHCHKLTVVKSEDWKNKWDKVRFRDE